MSQTNHISEDSPSASAPADRIKNLQVKFAKLEKENQKLEQVKSQWEATLDAVDDPLFVHDEKFCIIRSNTAYARYTGMSVKEIIGKPYWKLFPKSNAPMPGCKAAIEESKERSEEDVILDTGEYFFSRSFCRKGSDGNYCVHILENVTEQRLLQEEIKKQHAFVVSLYESLNHPFYVIDAEDYTIKLANSAACKGIQGTSLTCYALTHGQDKPCSGEHSCPLELVKKTKKPAVVEHIHYDKNGNRRIMEVRGYPILDEDGNVAQIIEYSLDITERKQAEERASSVIDTARDAFISMDKNGIIIDWNPQAETTFGWSREEALGQSLEKTIVPPNLRKKHCDGLKRYFDTGDGPILHSTIEIEARHRNGKNFPIELSIVPLQMGEDVVFNAFLRDITTRKKSAESLQRVNRVLKTLSAGNMAVVRSKSEGELLWKTCHVLVNEGDYRMAWIGYAEQDKKKSVRPMAHAGAEDGYLDEVFISWADNKWGKGPEGTAIRTGKTSYVEDVATDSRYAPWCKRAVDHGYASIISLPLLLNGQAFGQLNIYSAVPTKFIKEEVKLLEEMAGDLAYGIVALRTEVQRERNAQALQESQADLKQALVGSIYVASKASEARDPYTAGHQQRVAKLAVAIARELDWPSDRVEGLRLSAMIHDIGKINVPAEILSNPGRLTKTEIDLVKSHAVTGYEILKDVNFPWPVADIAHQHHERIDGSGYPQGLKADQICDEAKIVAVADVVEAMSSHRPYRPTLGLDAALAEIESKKGIWFDVDIVDICTRLLRERGTAFLSD